MNNTSNPPPAQTGRPGQQQGAAPFQLQVWGATDTGKVRDHNEDNIYPTGDGTPLPDGSYLLLVADGVGGGSFGQTASSMAKELIVDHCRNAVIAPNYEPRQVLLQAVQAANQAIYGYIASLPPGSNPSSTIVVALVRPNRQIYIANVGNSRTYLIRNGKAIQITKDHSLTQQKLDVGVITPQQATSDDDRNIITRSLGDKQTVQVDIFSHLKSYQPPQANPLADGMKDGDTLLLCSDGLTDMLPNDPATGENNTLVKLATLPPQKATGRLIKEANKQGGHDNISVVIARAPGEEAAGMGGLAAVTGFWASATKIEKGAIMAVAGLIFITLAAITALFSFQPGAGPVTASVMTTTAVAAETPPPAQTPLPAASAASPTPAENTAAAPTPLPDGPTPLPFVTSTPIPLPTLTPTYYAAQPQPTSGENGPPPSPTTSAALPHSAPPVLLNPNGGTAQKGIPIQFRWRWDGELQENQQFEILIWRPGSEHSGAYDVREMGNIFRREGNVWSASIDVGAAAGVSGKGQYNWSVALAQIEPYRRIGPEAAPKTLNYVPREEPPEKPGKPTPTKSDPPPGN